ncbi:MAG TPA: AMP-binding protein [Acidimicrobiales bacterium]|nr:AMP-binding protein [Acidimicrobiales bacterium]
MATLLSMHATEHPDAPAIIDVGGTVAWADLDERVNRLIDALRARGLTLGDTIVVMAGNERATYEVTLAAMHGGWTVVPVNWHWVADELAYVIGDAGADALIVGADWVEVGATAAGETIDVRIAVGDGAAAGFERYEEVLAAASPAEPPDQVKGGPMFYTSGTTGFPKGVRGALATTGDPVEMWSLIAASLAEMMEVPDAGATQLVCGPAYHSAQWIYGMVPLVLGGTLVLQHRFDAAAVLDAIDTHGVTGVHLVPAQFVRMLRLDDDVRTAFDGSSLVAVHHGAAPCPPEVKRAMIDWWGPIVTEYYGGTEGGFIAAISAAEWLEHPGSVGRVLSTMEVFATDAEGNRLGPGEAGELWFKNLLGMDFEYHNAPDKTAAAHREPGVVTLGDVGYLDDDGFLYLSDRKIDMIISGGVNIYPAEIEGVLAGHPDVADVAVFGIPDDEMGEQVLAVVEPIAGRTPADDFAAELASYTREHLAGYKCPRRWEFTDALPRNEVGKLAKKTLRAPYWDADRAI